MRHKVIRRQILTASKGRHGAPLPGATSDSVNDIIYIRRCSRQTLSKFAVALPPLVAADADYNVISGEQEVRLAGTDDITAGRIITPVFPIPDSSHSFWD